VGGDGVVAGRAPADLARFAALAVCPHMRGKDRIEWSFVYGMIFWIGLNSVVSLCYYMRLAKAVVIDQADEPLAPAEPAPVSYRLLAVCKGAALLALFFWFEPVQRLCVQVLETLR
jgi:NADH:ubiquinone oxidoreductase subunit 2 (subunit N)